MSQGQVCFPDLLALADTCLLLGHRLSEWCGHGPILEEDIALTNHALDLIGQARKLYQLHAARVGGGLTEDKLAYLREPEDFLNQPLAALENGDYAQSMARAWLIAAWMTPLWQALIEQPDHDLAVIAAESVKEARILERHAGDWVVRFADGTEESQRRLRAGWQKLAPLVPGLLGTVYVGVDRGSVERAFLATIRSRLAAGPCADLIGELSLQDGSAMAHALEQAEQDRRNLLAEMQSLPRQYPEAVW